MQGLIDLYKNSEYLHHAYLFIGHEVHEVVSKLKNFLEEHLGIKTSGNPDVYHGKFSTFSVGDARTLSEKQERKSLETTGGRKIFIIETDFITEEAQNALLKIFEEPTLGTHFFIISPQDVFLPTLRSRMQVIDARSTKDEVQTNILDLSFADRLVKVKEITEAISDEEKTKQDAISFLNQVEAELYSFGVEKRAEALRVCEEARQSLYDRGAPVKMILENVMLSI
jgi:DNA polymerase III delta prime subunit